MIDKNNCCNYCQENYACGHFDGDGVMTENIACNIVKGCVISAADDLTGCIVNVFQHINLAAIKAHHWISGDRYI